jgi:hypothetical protein
LKTVGDGDELERLVEFVHEARAIRGETDPAQLRTAFQHVYERHIAGAAPRRVASLPADLWMPLEGLMNILLATIAIEAAGEESGGGGGGGGVGGGGRAAKREGAEEEEGGA